VLSLCLRLFSVRVILALFKIKIYPFGHEMGQNNGGAPACRFVNVICLLQELQRALESDSYPGGKS
jgi:hypothetical protein